MGSVSQDINQQTKEPNYFYEKRLAIKKAIISQKKVIQEVTRVEKTEKI